MFNNFQGLFRSSNQEREKMKRFHSEEIMLILFICAADLSNYDDNYLVDFAEAIEGRADVLFERSYLQGMQDYFQLNDAILEDFQELNDILISFYAPSWRKKMKDSENYWGDVNILANKLLKELSIKWVEPLTFIDTHFDLS
jgi:hypothetical protein